MILGKKELDGSKEILGAEESTNLLAQNSVKNLKEIEVFFCEVEKQVGILKKNFKNKIHMEENMGFRSDKCSKGVVELEKCSEIDHGRAVLGAGDLTHRAYVVDSSEGPSTGLAKEHIGERRSDDIDKNVFNGDVGIHQDVIEEVFEESAGVQHEGLEKAILSQLLKFC